MKSLEFSVENLKAERDAKLAELSSPVKGEFETTAMYEKRKKDAKRIAQEIRDEYASKIAGAKRKHNEQIDKIQQQIDELLVGSQEPTESGFTLGVYNAEKQEFPITISKTNKTSYVSVALAVARNFKENADHLKAKGVRLLSENGSWKYFNWRVDFEGQSFAFGPTKGKSTGKNVCITQNIIPPNLSVQIAFSEPSGDDRLDAEEIAEFVVTLKNKGQGPALDVEILCNLSGSDAVDFPNSAYIGEIPAGENRTKRLKFTASENVGTGSVTVTFQFKERHNFQPDDQDITFETEALIPPKLEIVDIGIDDLSGNSKIEPGETVEITVRVQNLGQGSADNVKAKVNIESSEVFFFGKSQESFNLDCLAPGEYKDFSFEIVPNKKAKAMPISVTITETHGRFGISNHSLNLAFNQVQRNIDAMIIAGKDEKKERFSATTGLSIDIDKDIPTAKSKNENALAVIFGIEEYENVSKATFAKRDAAITKEYFERTLGIPKNRIYYQINDDVSKAEFDKVFSKDGWLDKRVSPKTEVYFYFAGHGAPELGEKENKPYLIPCDGDPNYLSQTGYSVDVLCANLGKLGAKSVTAFLDACFSGANRESEMLLADIRPIYVEVENPSAYGINVFSASSGNQISYAYPQMKHGLFTYFLLKGMRGEADADENREITLDELGEYIKKNVSDQAGFLDGEQTPQPLISDKKRVLIRY